MRAIREAAVHGEPDDGSERVTSLRFGEPVVAGEDRGGWTHVRVPEQPTHLDSAGYPGWVRTDALAEDDPLAVARGFLGTPYVWGGMSHDGIDCSGLVHLAYRAIGVCVPRDAADQHAAADSVADPVPGDLYFFARPGQEVHHVGFVTEVGMLHAGENGVAEEPMTDDRRATLIGAWRLPR